jgi:protein SCO1/2
MMQKKWLFLILLTIPVLAITAVWFWQSRPHTFSGIVNDPTQVAPDFTLTDQTEAAFTLSDFRGQWILLAYGYTTCPDVCPATLANIKRIEALLGEQAEDVRVVFVSIDPARDTPEVMGRYVAHFGDDYKGLTGTAEAVAVAAEAYDVKYEAKAVDSAAGYLMNHSAYIYLIDPQFQWRETFPFGVTPQNIADDVVYWMHTVEEK